MKEQDPFRPYSSHCLITDEVAYPTHWLEYIGVDGKERIKRMRIMLMEYMERITGHERESSCQGGHEKEFI
jgi:hypothetical protein